LNTIHPITLNVKEYISSGIIETYVLGLATPEERAEFEKMCREYPELLAARLDFEATLETRLGSLASDPGQGTKEKVLDAIRQQSPVNQTKIITMEHSTTPRQSSSARIIAAASVILLLGAAFFAYRFYSENKELKNSNLVLKSKVETADSTMNKLSEEQKIMKDPNVAVVNLVGTEKKSANVYWDSASANVYLVVKNMPKLPNEQQYQLWALIDGKPVDLGLFDGESEKVILKMNNTQKADAFAITIESRGNTGGPHLDKLQSMGKPRL
jgi:anti-sigma-K factor RskA